VIKAEVWSNPQNTGALSLSGTCRRFYPIATPLLYRNIVVIRIVPLELPFKLLARTITENEELAVHCKSIELGLDDDESDDGSDDGDYALADKVLHHFIQVKSLFSV
jgi:hypothetical protein